MIGEERRLIPLKPGDDGASIKDPSQEKKSLAASLDSEAKAGVKAGTEGLLWDRSMGGGYWGKRWRPLFPFNHIAQHQGWYMRTPAIGP